MMTIPPEQNETDAVHGPHYTGRSYRDGTHRILETADGEVRRIVPCGCVRLRFRHTVFDLDAAGLARLRAQTFGALVATTRPATSPAARVELFVPLLGVGFVIGRDEATALLALLDAAWETLPPAA